MMLSIVKGIGLVILILIAIIILTLIQLLFVPIRYRFSGTYKERIDGQMRVSWLPLLLRADVSYQEENLEYTVRLFGGIILTNTKQKVSWLGRKLFAEDAQSESDEDDRMEEENVQPVQEDGQRKEAVVQTQKKDDQRRMAEQRMNHEGKTDRIDSLNEHGQIEDTKASRDQTKTEKSGEASALNRLTDKIKDKVKQWKQSFQRIKASYQKGKSKKEALLRIYHSKRFEQVKKDLRRYMKDVLKIIKPDRLAGDVCFGLDDPANTAYILGGVAMLLPLYEPYVSITPDFTQKILEGSLEGKGKIRLFSIVRLAIKVILNKNLIKVTKKVQTILQA